MKWKPELLNLSYHGRTLRWTHEHGAITLSRTGIHWSYKHHVYGISVSLKNWLLGFNVYRELRATNLWIYPFPTVDIYIHWPRKEKSCEPKTISSWLKSRLRKA